MDILWCKGWIYSLEHYLPTADSLFHFYVCICPDEAFRKKRTPPVLYSISWFVYATRFVKDE